MPRKMTTGALRETLLKAIDDVQTGDLTEQKATAIAKLASQVNQSLLAEVEIMRYEIAGLIEGKVIGDLHVGGETADEKTIEHQTPAHETPAPRRMLANTPRVIVRQPAPGASHNFGDPPPGRSALDQQRAAQAKDARS